MKYRLKSDHSKTCEANAGKHDTVIIHSGDGGVGNLCVPREWFLLAWEPVPSEPKPAAEDASPLIEDELDDVQSGDNAVDVCWRAAAEIRGLRKRIAKLIHALDAANGSGQQEDCSLGTRFGEDEHVLRNAENGSEIRGVKAEGDVARGNGLPFSVLPEDELDHAHDVAAGLDMYARARDAEGMDLSARFHRDAADTIRRLRSEADEYREARDALKAAMEAMGFCTRGRAVQV